MFKESYHKAKLITEQEGFLNESSPKGAMFHMIKVSNFAYHKSRDVLAVI